MRKSYAKKPFARESGVCYENISNYLGDIFSLANSFDGYVCFRSGPLESAAQSWLDVKNLGNIELELRRHDVRNAFFSFSTFKKCKYPRHTTENIRSVFAWSIDVDYVNAAAKPEDVFQHIMGNVPIPVPNYIEYGHRLRLVYIFAQPLRISGKQGAKLLKGFHFMQKCFADMINESLGFDGASFGAEANSACSFFRIPGSINTKDGSRICIKHITNERLTLQELFSDFVPDRMLDVSGNKNEWYDTWKSKKEKEGERPFSFHARMLWERRIVALEQIAGECGVNRKRTCFFYAVGLKNLGLVPTQEELVDKMLAFNERFQRPLTENEVKRQFKSFLYTDKNYKLRDETIAREIGINCEYFGSLNKRERDKERYRMVREKQIRNGNTKKQSVEKRRIEIAKLRRQGVTLQEIARMLSVSLSTVKRDVKEMITCKETYGERFVRTLEEITRDVERKCEIALEKVRFDFQPTGVAYFAGNFLGRPSSEISASAAMLSRAGAADVTGKRMGTCLCSLISRIARGPSKSNVFDKTCANLSPGLP